MSILQTKWTALVAGGLAYVLTTWAVLQPHKQLAQAAAALEKARETRDAPVAGPSWTFQNAELEQLMGELKNEREAARLRATQLDGLEARLASEHQEICSVTQTVARLQGQLDVAITRVSDAEVNNLKKLAKVYATMSPESAARILKEMDDEPIVKILALMKESESAPIIESLGQGNRGEAKRVAAISDRLRLTLVDSKKNPAP